MLALGVVMAIIFVWVRLRPWPAFRRAVDAGDRPAAAAALERIRRWVTVNLVLGVAVIVIAAGRLGT